MDAFGTVRFTMGDVKRDSKKRANGEGSVRWSESRKCWLATLRGSGQPEMRRNVPRDIAKTNSDRGRDAALKWLEQWRTDERAGDEPLPPRTVREQLAGYLAHLKAANAKPRTYAARSATITKVLNDGLGHLQLGDLTAAHARALVRQLQGKNYSANYIRLAFYTLSAAVKLAIADGYLRVNPLLGVTPPTATKRPPPIVGDDVDLEAFLRAIRGRAWETAWIVAFACGLRLHELRALRWADIDETDKEIRVRSGAQPGDAGETVGWTKSGAGVRRIAYGQAVAAALDQQKELNLTRRTKAGDRWTERDLVWPNTTGGITDEGVLEKALRRAMKSGGLPHLWPHALRHAFVTNILGEDVDLAMASRAAGHSSVRITGDVYSHATKRADRKVAQAIDRIFLRAVGDSVGDSAENTMKPAPDSRSEAG